MFSLLASMTYKSGFLAVVLLVAVAMAIGSWLVHERFSKLPTTMLQAQTPSWMVVLIKLGLLASLSIGTVIGAIEVLLILTVVFMD